MYHNTSIEARCRLPGAPPSNFERMEQKIFGIKSGDLSLLRTGRESMEKSENLLTRPANRRSFLKSGILAGGAAATMSAGLFNGGIPAFGEDSDTVRGLTKGDIAILRFLAAAELIESDLW